MEKPEYPMRVNKYLAHKNYATRGGADALVEAGLVFVNGKRAVLGQKISETEKGEVRNRGKQKAFTYIAYYKPRGIITHSAQKGEREIKEVLPVKGVFPVGRLDKDSSGLIILTDDGRVTERLLGPKFAHEKEYFVKTKEPLRSSFKKKMEAGVVIDKETTAPCRVHVFGERAFSITLTEGKKHQIRRMCVALFQEVEDLKRARIMNITLGKLKEGEYRVIEGEELKTFLKELGLG
jgi:23S rRNA pseudouridine2604 synthase